MPVEGKSFGHPDFDPVWATAQELDLAVSLHLVVHPFYLGNEWRREPKPDFMFVSNERHSGSAHGADHHDLRRSL